MPDDFIVWRPVWDYIRDSYSKYKQLPTHDQIRLSFKDWEPPEGEFEYWLAEMRRITLVRQTKEAFNSMLPLLDSDPLAAIGSAMTRLAQIRAVGNVHMSATDETGAQRFVRYERRRELWENAGGKHLIGIPTGLKYIDDTHMGWLPSEMVGFYARPGVGKTWMLIRQGAVAWAAGWRILLISPEMTCNQIEQRVDVCLARAMGAELSHQALLAGDPKMRAMYQAYTEALKESGRWWTFDSWNGRNFSVDDIRIVSDQLDPHLILIDGIGLLRIERHRNGQATWERLEDTCGDLKAYATASGKTIIASHQARRVGEMRGAEYIMPSLNDAAGGEALVRFCSTIFTMCPDKEHREIKWYSIRKSRERDIQDAARMALGWNIDKGEIIDCADLQNNTGAILARINKKGVK